MSNVPKIEPIKITEYTSKQSKYDVVAKLPLRDIVLGPSGSGKGILLQNLILNVYRGCYDRIYIFSPSIFVDKTWSPVIEYIKKDLNVNVEKEKCLFDTFDTDELTHIVETQKKIAEHMKSQNYKRIYQILIVIDDWADDYKASHNPVLNSLFTKGRHSMISVIVSSQKFRALSNIMRVNAVNLYVFRLRNAGDLEAFVEEVSAVASKKELLQLYQIATDEPYSFLFVKLNAKKVEDMFYLRFEKNLY
jgi:stress-induced morphogen